jgi:hypothetical protein
MPTTAAVATTTAVATTAAAFSRVGRGRQRGRKNNDNKPQSKCRHNFLWSFSGGSDSDFIRPKSPEAPAVRISRTNLGFVMWTPTTRQQHSRTVTRYQTDLTDAEWLVIAPRLPKPCATGRPREWPMREIINDILCHASRLLVAAGAERPAPMGDDLPPVRRLARRRTV